MAKQANTTGTTGSNDNMVQLATRIPADLHRSVKLHCVSTGVSMGDFIATCLTNGIAASAPKASKAK